MKSLTNFYCLLIALLAFGVPPVVNAQTYVESSAPKLNCFQIHLKTAIVTNRERRQRYADLSHGKSKKISRILIFVEKIGLLMAKKYDSKSLPYIERGMTVLCDELLSPRPIPEFEAYVEPTGYVPEKFISSGGTKLTRQLSHALKHNGFAAVAQIAKDKLNELKLRPSFNCLLRNDMTTIYKASSLAPKYIAQSKALGLESTEKLYRKFLKSVISILPFVDGIDRQAFPIQKQGVPIICQDFPEARPE